MTDIFWKGIALLALIISFVAVAIVWHASNPVAVAGSVGGQLIENYDPYVRYNGGVKTNLPMTLGGAVSMTSTAAITGAATLSSTLAVTATTTMSSNLVISTSNTATSSVEVGCIQTYATSTLTPIRLSATTTPGVAVWMYGKCFGR